MSFVIALAGKGGTGKTTIASLLVKILKEADKGSVLAVDADPNSNLAEFLGVKAERTIGAILDEIAENPDKVPKGMPKDRFIEYEVEKALDESAGYGILTMGRPEGPGCYCYVNNLLRNMVGKLIKDYDYVVIDNEAGLEHLSRRTMRNADSLVIVSDPTQAGLRAAKRILALAGELKIKTNKKFLLINRARAAFDARNLKGFEDVVFLGELPEDEEILKLSLNGSSLAGLDDRSAGLERLKEMAKKIWQSN
ncbi:MAG: AAA family ATPase [Candidatus Omnitrophica bacterium]|nr:AAA family ATPase [Candidatus Omnitrophota bacterium]MDD5610399.1 AAA family ATPase [Candidatus Omnitrophota bacterium]